MTSLRDFIFALILVALVYAAPVFAEQLGEALWCATADAGTDTCVGCTVDCLE